MQERAQRVRALRSDVVGGEAVSTERTLERIDGALEDWDQWDGHSPDAARWDGDDWIDARRPERSTAEDLHESWRRLFCTAVDAALAEDLVPMTTREPPGENEPLTEEGMLRVMRRIRDSEPRAIVSPATASAIRQAAHEAGERVDVIVSEHVPDGQAYIFRPPPLDGRRR